MVDNIHSFSTTAIDNVEANTGIEFDEKQLPSTVNNANRDFGAAIKALLLDIAGSNTVGGTADAITVTTTAPFGTSFANDHFFAFRAGADNTGAATLTVNGGDAKAIRKGATGGDADIEAGDIKEDGIYFVAYSTTADGGSGAWMLYNPSGGGVESIQDIVGAMFSGNTETRITVTYQDADGTIDFVVDDDLANYDNTNSGFATTGKAIAMAMIFGG